MYDVLWSTLAQARAGRPPERAMFDRLTQAAKRLDDAELQAFLDQDMEAFHALDDPALHDEASRVLGGCGDDRFLDVRAWIVAHGEEVWRRIRADPRELGRLDEPEPQWESGELLEGVRRVAWDRGLLPPSQRPLDPAPPTPSPAPKGPRARSLPWPVRLKRLGHPRAGEIMNELRTSLREDGRYETPIGVFVREGEGDERTVRFEPSEQLLAHVPYGPVPGDHPLQEIFDHMLAGFDGEPDQGARVSGVGWFGLLYHGVTEDGQDDWELQYIPPTSLLRHVGATGDLPLDSTRTELLGLASGGAALTGTGKGSSEAEPPETAGGSPRKPWWKRLLGLD